jgi:hypothetical protein
VVFGLRLGCPTLAADMPDDSERSPDESKGTENENAVQNSHRGEDTKGANTGRVESRRLGATGYWSGGVSGGVGGGVHAGFASQTVTRRLRREPAR